MPAPVAAARSSTAELAGIGQRIGARLLDWALWSVLGLIGLMYTSSFVALWFIAAVLYEPWMTAVCGQTLGKKALGIEVIRADNGLAPGWGKSLGRWVIPTAASALLFGVGGLLVYISAAWDDRRQGWHDMAVKTFVVRA